MRAAVTSGLTRLDSACIAGHPPASFFSNELEHWISKFMWLWSMLHSCGCRIYGARRTFFCSVGQSTATDVVSRFFQVSLDGSFCLSLGLQEALTWPTCFDLAHGLARSRPF